MRPNSRPLSIQTLILSLMVVIALMAAFVFAMVRLFPSGWPERGVVGDTFGVLNTLFSGSAFAGLIYTIVIQRNLLHDQLDQEKTWARTQLTLDLYARWHSPEMYSLRIRMSQLGNDQMIESMRERAYRDDLESVSLFQFVQFFEQLALLVQNDHIDRHQMNLLFGPYLKFYGKHILRRLQLLEEHDDFRGRLKLIDEQLLKPADAWVGYNTAPLH